MKPKYNVLLTAFLTLFIFSAVLYTACHKDKCKDVVCFNRGACDGGNCVCPTGYEGPKCELLSRDKFIRTFNGWDTCSLTPVAIMQYPVHFHAVLADSLELMMNNFLNDPDDSAVCTIRSTDSFTFLGSNNSTVFNGHGKMRHDTLIMIYHVSRDTTAYNCKFVGGSLR